MEQREQAHTSDNITKLVNIRIILFKLVMLLLSSSKQTTVIYLLLEIK